MHFLNNIIANQKFWYAFILFLVGNGIYISVMRMMVATYARKKNKKPLHYKLYRYYSADMVKKVTSKSEKTFYQKSNKITLVMNTVIIASAIFCIYALSK